MELRQEVSDGGVMAALNRAVQLGVNQQQPLEAAGRALLTRVQLGFRRGVDPYGREWKQPVRGGQPLVDSGRLRKSFSFSVESGALVIGTNVRYAQVHQEGATITAKNHPYLRFKVGDQWVQKKQVEIPARPMLPNPAEGLPATWSGDAIAAIDSYVGKL